LDHVYNTVAVHTLIKKEQECENDFKLKATMAKKKKKKTESLHTFILKLCSQIP